MPVSRFTALAGIPERTYRRRLARLRAGDHVKGPWPAPKVESVEALAAKYAADWPAWGHRKIAALMRADGHDVNRPGMRAGSEATREAWGHASTEEVSGRVA